MAGHSFDIAIKSPSSHPWHQDALCYRDSIAGPPGWPELGKMVQPALEFHENDTLESHENDAQALPPPNYPPTAKDWETYRPLFTQLYSVENRTLKEVMDIFRTQYSFRATRRMFNHRVLDWNLCKNYKASERKEVVELLTRHQIDGQNISSVLVRGQPVKLHRLRKEFTGTSPPFLDRRVKKRTPKPRNLVDMFLDDLRLRITLSGTPVSPLSTPPQLKYAETILYQTNVNFEVNLKSYVPDKGTYASKVDDSIADDLDLENIPYSFVNKIDFALSDLAAGKHETAWRLLDEASDMAKSVFESRHPKIFQALLFEAADWSLSAPPDLFKALYTFIANMGATVLGANNPISLMCLAITQLEAGGDIYATAYHLLVSKLQQLLGPHHKVVTSTKDEMCTVLFFSGKVDEAERMQMDLVEQCDGVDPYSSEALWALYALGSSQRRKGDFINARKNLWEVSERAKTFDGELFVYNAIEISVLKDLVPTMAELGEHIEAQLFAERLLERAVKRWTMEDWQPGAIIIELDGILREQGKLEEAEKLRQQYPKAF